MRAHAALHLQATLFRVQPLLEALLQPHRSMNTFLAEYNCLHAGCKQRYISVPCLSDARQQIYLTTLSCSGSIQQLTP